jgi:hypothetical protein
VHPYTFQDAACGGHPAAGLLAVLVVAGTLGCSAGDPPNPDAARTTTVPTEAPADGEADEPDEEEAEEPEEPELPDADDATLDGLEEQFEDAGVKDIRGAPGEPVTIRLEDELTVADSAAACDAVCTAGIPDVVVDIDGVVTPCP